MAVRKIGLRFYIGDHDQKLGKMDDQFNLYGHDFTSVRGSASETFAPFMLAGPDGRSPNISAVESVTWARIKASFRE